jgi:membrane protease YdiL (CAAX protease family)
MDRADHSRDAESKADDPMQHRGDTQPDHYLPFQATGSYDRCVRSRPLVFFLLAFVITWIVWVPRALEAEWAQLVGTIWAYGPALAAIATAALLGGRAELRELGTRFNNWRIGWRLTAAIILGPLAVSLLQSVLTTVLTGTPWNESLPEVFSAPLPVWFVLIAVLTLTDGLGEELGWRGYALPNLVEKYNATAVSIGLGLIWAAWHLPLFWTEGASLEATPIWLLFLRLPATSVIFTWVYRHTGGSILAAALFHGALNLFSLPPPKLGEPLTPAIISVALQWTLALLLVAVAGRQLDRWPTTVAAPSNEATAS